MISLEVRILVKYTVYKSLQIINYVTDDDEDLDVSNLENSEPTRNLSFSSQRFEDKKMLYESYMADPTIPPSQKNAMGFWKSLYQPTYSTQKLCKLLEQRNLLPPNKVPNKLKVSKTKAFNEDYGYDDTFFASTKVLLEEQRRREDIPRAIKDIYEKKGIVSASQIYNIEQNLNCDNDESGTNEIQPSTSGTKNKVLVEPPYKELSKSLLELSRTVSEQYEISQIMKDINNISDLDASLTDLTEKIQYSSKAEQIVNHTISCSQRLKLLDDIYTADICINTCDILSDEEESKKSSQESHCEQSSKAEQRVNHTISCSQRLKILDDIYTADVSINTCDILSEESKKRSQDSHCDLIRDIFKTPVILKMQSKSDINDNIPDNENVPKEVKFSFASGKAINFDSKSIMKFKTIFDNEEKKRQSEENSKDPVLPKNPSQSTSLQADQVLHQNNENAVKNVGFVFASGKSALISTSKLEAFEKKFKAEEAKLKKLEGAFPSISIELSPQKSKDNKENDGNAQNSPKKTSQEDLKSQKSGEITQKSRTLQRLKGESSALRRTRSKSLLGLKPKRVRIDESLIDKNPVNDSTTDSKIDQNLTPNPEEIKQSVPAQIGFSFASGKNIKISDAKLSKFKNIFESEEKNMDMLENVKEPQHVGFTFASGKNIKIDNASVAKFKNLFETEERNMDLLESLKESAPQQQTASNLNSGFVFASGKATNIDRNKLLDFEKKFKEEEEKLKKIDAELKAPEYSKNSNKVADNKSKSTGSQRKLFGNLLTENQQSSTENAFKSIRNEKPPENSKSNDIQIEINDISLASQYRSSMDVYRSSSEDEDIKAAKKLLKSITFNKSKSVVTKKLKKHNFGKRSSLSDIKLSDQMIPTRPRKSSHIEDKSLNDEKKQSQSKRLEVQPSTSKCAFTLASGKNVDINQSKINDAKKNFAGDVDENDISIPCQSEKSQASKIADKASTSSKSSSKAGNTSINFHSHRLSSLRAKRKHDDDDSDIFNFEFSTHSLKSKKTSQTSATPVHKAIDSGIESGEKLTNKVESPQMSFKKTAFFAPMFTSSPVVNPPTAKNRPKFLRYNDKRPEDRRIAEEVEEIKRKFRPDVDRKEEVLDKEFGELVVFKPTAAKRLAMDNDDEIMISPIVKDKKRQRRSYDTPMSSNNFRQFDYFKHQTLSQRIAEVDAFMDLQSQIKLIGNDPTESQVVSILEIEQEHLSRFETEKRVKREREEGIKEQIEYVNNKPEDESRQMTGTMFMMKSGSRQNLKDYVGNEQPHDKNIHEWTFDNLLDFKFDMKNYADEAWSKVSVIVADNAKLIMDEMSNVGYNEIKYSFLASYGVDPKLVKHEWLENAYKMILLKFIWMENSFEKIEKFEVLTPENVLLQLKYRYDREIDRHQRPAIRKITERDEVPNRRIVLKVIDIIYSLNVGYELELSDGWYKMRSCVDSCLAEAISRKKIAINTKLIICNSELVNMFSSAYHPLELPKGIRLKIHGNSTRIASYDMKLGFCKIPYSFLIPVDCISSDGGIIGRLKIFIIHVYTMIYVESNGEKKGESN